MSYINLYSSEQWQGENEWQNGKILCNTFRPLEGFHWANNFIDGILYVLYVLYIIMYVLYVLYIIIYVLYVLYIILYVLYMYGSGRRYINVSVCYNYVLWGIIENIEF